MSEATADNRRRIRWNFTTVLEDLDFADDISLATCMKDWEISRGSSQSRPQT